MRNLFAIILSLLFFAACQRTGENHDFTRLREEMVANQILARGIKDSLVLKAMGKVPRHSFLPMELRDLAYQDGALPIGFGQTISQPYVVALMTQALNLNGDEKVLEVGTGSGYQAAILAEIAKEVYSIEIIPELAQRADSTLKSLGYKNIHVRVGDGFLGWPEAAPFQAIIVTCAPEEAPRPLIQQLADGGRLVIPVGEQGRAQMLRRYIKTEKGVFPKDLGEVYFVPMLGDSALKYKKR